MIAIGSSIASARRAGKPPQNVRFLIDFETASNGSAVSTTTLANCTRGEALTWTQTTPAPVHTIATSAEKALRRAVKTGGTKYTDTGSTRGLSLAHASNDAAWWTGTTATTYDTFTCGLWIRTSLPNPDFVNYDLFAMYSGSGAYFVLQWRDGVFRAHTSAGAGVGSNISASRNTWYWASMLWVRNDKGYLRLYNESGGLVGASESTLPNQPFSKVFIGCDGHGSTPAQTTLYDDIIGVEGNAHPILIP